MSETRETIDGLMALPDSVDAEELAADLAMLVQAGLVEIRVRQLLSKMKCLPLLVNAEGDELQVAAALIDIVEAGIAEFADLKVRDALGTLFGSGGRALWQGAEDRRSAAVETLWPDRYLDQDSYRRSGQPAALHSLARRILANQGPSDMTPRFDVDPPSEEPDAGNSVSVPASEGRVLETLRAGGPVDRFIADRVIGNPIRMIEWYRRLFQELREEIHETGSFRLGTRPRDRYSTWADRWRGGRATGPGGRRTERGSPHQRRQARRLAQSAHSRI